jgi:hypothetical protein
VDTNQRRDAAEVKTHEEILSLFRELDRIEERVKNLQLSDDAYFDTDKVLQEVEITEPSVEIIQEPRSEQPIDTNLRDTQKKKNHFSLLVRHKKERASRKRMKRVYFSKKEQPATREPSAETELQHHVKKVRERAKPLKSTFNLHITEDGTLAGLDVKRPKPPKAQNGFFRRRHKSETDAQPQEVQAPGFKGKMKRLVSKIIPHRSKKGETSTGLGSRIKGIFKRGTKE